MLAMPPSSTKKLPNAVPPKICVPMVLIIVPAISVTKSPCAMPENA